MWRPILEGKLTYTEASKMTHHQLFEANAALDIYIEKIKEARGGH
jgi:hypothetical protein